MASMSGGRRAVSGPKTTGKLARLCIEVEGNGFKVCKELVPKPGRQGMMWSPPKPGDSMVFTDAAACAKYVGECLGAKAEKKEQY